MKVYLINSWVSTIHISKDINSHFEFAASLIKKHINPDNYKYEYWGNFSQILDKINYLLSQEKIKEAAKLYNTTILVSFHGPLILQELEIKD